MDPSIEFIKYARKKYNKKFLIGEAGHLPFKNKRFGIILINGVLHHLDNIYIPNVVEEVYRILIPKGKVIVLEDTEKLKIFNPLGKIVHKFDLGNYIRKEKDYLNFFKDKFKLINKTNYITGICEYVGFLLEKS